MSEEVKEVTLKPLTKKQMKFVEYFEGNLTDAARKVVALAKKGHA